MRYGSPTALIQHHTVRNETRTTTLTYRYDAEGRLEASTDALGRETTYGLDALDRVLATAQNATAPTTAKDRATIGSLYDALDRPTSVTDPNNLVTAYERNAFGDLLQLQSPDTGVSTATYDSAGNLRQSVDADGRQRLQSHDALNRVTAVSYPQDTTLNETYLFDSAQADCPVDEAFLVGRLARMTDGSGSTTYCYNRFGDLVRKVQRTQGKTFVLRWHYAANGRLQSMTYPDGSVIDYLHDAQGRVVEIGVRAHGSLSRNPEGGSLRQRMVHGVLYHPFDGPAQWTTGNGRRLVRTLNLSGQPGVVQAQSADGTPIDGLSLGYEFDAAGNLVKLRDGNQAEPPQRLYRYDGLNRLTEAKNGAGVVQEAYAYDPTGNRTVSGRRESRSTQDCTGVPPGGTCLPGPTIDVWSTRTYTSTPQRHRLWTVGNTERTYDAAGNTIRIGPRQVDHQPPPDDSPPADPTESAAYAGTEQVGIGLEDGDEVPPGILEQVFVYSAANRLASLSVEGQPIMSYRYNGHGERVYRSGSGQTAYTLFDPAGHWIGDYDENGKALQQAIWLGGRGPSPGQALPVGLLVRHGGETRLYHIEADALGTPRAVIDPTRGTLGTVVWRWDLSGEAFGEDAPNEDPDGDGTRFVLDLRFPGQQYDSASGLNYNYFRDYDAATGRYSQSDLIGLAGGISTYGYVGGNPMSYVDPLGLDGIRVDRQAMYELGSSHGKRIRAAGILIDYWVKLDEKNVKGADPFYHCLASCEATKAVGDPQIVLDLLDSKEDFDRVKANTTGYEGRNDWTVEEFRRESAGDVEANKLGASCPPGQSCVKRCKHLLDIVAPHRRKFLSEFRPEWAEKPKK